MKRRPIVTRYVTGASCFNGLGMWKEFLFYPNFIETSTVLDLGAEIS